MTNRQLFKSIKTKLEKQLQEDSIKCRRFLLIAPQQHKVSGVGNYEKFVIPKIIETIESGFLNSLNECLSTLEHQLLFSCQKKRYLKMFLNIAAQQSTRIKLILEDDKHLKELTESTTILINCISPNLSKKTEQGFKTLILQKTPIANIFKTIFDNILSNMIGYGMSFLLGVLGTLATFLFSK